MALPEALAAVDAVAQALGATRLVELPEVERARAAAFVITNAEGAALHLADLKNRAPGLRAAVARPLPGRRAAARRLGGAGAARARLVRAPRGARLRDVDVLLAPATPCAAPAIGTEWLEIDGQRLPARASMGLLTQPVSCIGLPVVTVPLWG